MTESTKKYQNPVFLNVKIFLMVKLAIKIVLDVF